MPNLRRVGREAEDQAADYLLKLGYTIVTRRYHTSRSELDIVALDGEVLVFVEVKFRRTPGYSPEDSLSASKLANLGRAMELYIVEMEVRRRVRLDLIAIDADGLRHYKDLLRP